MIQENSTLLQKLKQYSALAGAFFAATEVAHAQVIYTNVDPDYELDAVNYFPGDSYSIDLNNDGTTDFLLRAFHTSYTNGIVMIPDPPSSGNSNGIMGSLNGGTGYVSALAANQNIDSGEFFFKMNDIINSSGGYIFPILFSGSVSDPIGEWAGVTDNYIGMRFSLGGSLHYGWMRCDVPADGSYILIKDYGFQSTPNQGLFAGQGNPLGIDPQNLSKSISIFGYEGVANIFVKDQNLDGATVRVTNMLGENVLIQSLTDRDTHIDLNQFGKGIYLVTVQRGNEVLSKKISFR